MHWSPDLQEVFGEEVGHEDEGERSQGGNKGEEKYEEETDEKLEMEEVEEDKEKEKGEDGEAYERENETKADEGSLLKPKICHDFENE